MARNYSEDLCRPNATTGFLSWGDETSVFHDPFSTPETSQSGIWRLMFFARILVGIGAAPVQPYGISYMDDHASRAMAPLYIGVLLAISMVGPALGYILGSATTQIYVDFDRSSASLPVPPSLTPKDADWLGAWWLGFLLASGVMFLLHIPFWFFPKCMKKEEEPMTTRTTMVTMTTTTTGKIEMERQTSQDGGETTVDEKLIASSENNNAVAVRENGSLANGAAPTATEATASATIKSPRSDGDTKTRLETGSA